MGNVVTFPYDACRRVHSRKQRRSKYGTPEERAAKAKVATSTTAAIIGSRGNVELNPAEIPAACLEVERLFYQLNTKLMPVALTWLRHLASGSSA